MSSSNHQILYDKTTKKLIGWGYNYYGQLAIKKESAEAFLIENKNNVISISLGSESSILLNKDGSIEGCGFNKFGELGIKNENRDYIICPLKTLDIGIKVKNVRTGMNFTILISIEYDVYSFGINNYGQLGLGDNVDRKNPQKLSKKFKDVICGYWHVFFVDIKNDYYRCGSNNHRQLLMINENGWCWDKEPKKLEALYKIKKIFCGNDTTFIITDKNELYASGINNFCQLGCNNSTIDEVCLPRKVDCQSGYFTHIELGEYHTLAYTSTKELYSFGYNACRQLGIGKKKFGDIQNKIELPETSIEYFWCGESNSYILGSSGKIYSCGTNLHNQLGFGCGFEYLESLDHFSDINQDKENPFIKYNGTINRKTRLVPLYPGYQKYKQYQRKQSFMILYYANRKIELTKSPWKRVPPEIIKEICNFI